MYIIVNLQLSEIKCDLQKVLVAEICCRVDAGSGGLQLGLQTPAQHCPMADIHKYLRTAANCCGSHMHQPTLTYNQWLMFTYAEALQLMADIHVRP